MKVFIEEKNKTSTISFKGSVKTLLKRLRINHSTVLVVRNGKIASLDTKLSDSDSIRVLEVFMGG